MGGLEFFEENVKFMDALNGTECTFPEYNIYDPEITNYINRKPSPIFCGIVQPYLVYLNWDGTLHLNQTEVLKYNFMDLKCTYCPITSNETDDYEVIYGTEIDISTFPITVNELSIRVNCSDGGNIVYLMVHSHIKPISVEKMEINKKIPLHLPSVLIFGIDSMSRGNFIRTLPKTYDYLVNHLKMIVFEGFNKVADNTFPNMFALLTGFMSEKRDSLPDVPIWNYRVNSTIKRNDDLPIIWKTFAALGYVTMYVEECINAIFSYYNVGFLRDPVDYYLRSTYIALRQIEQTIRNDGKRQGDESSWTYCISNEPSYKYVLNYTEEFLTKMADLRYFALSFFVEMSHDTLTDVSNMDDDLEKFFRRMFESNNFNNTVLLVVGDHGHRFNGIRKTFIGRIEERMPFVGILLPEILKRSHPHLQKGLEHHTKRLLSFYDLHETLVDLAEDDLGEEPKKFRPGAIGKSLLRPFDNVRTCTQVGILPEYCMCDREAQVPKNSKTAFVSAMAVVEHINYMLSMSRHFINVGETRKCATLTLKGVSSASMSMKSFATGESSPSIRVILTTLPSYGVFEAVVVTQFHGEPPIVMGDVNRINKYDNQSNCIHHDILRLYCYCIESIV